MLPEIDRSPEMLANYWIAEEHQGEVIKFFHVKLPCYKTQKRAEYQQLGSLNGFRRRMAKRMAKHIDKHGYTFPAKSWRIVDSDTWQRVMRVVNDTDHNALATRMNVGISPDRAMADIPVIEVGDVFDFYEAIGYDYTRDKFFDGEPVTAEELILTLDAYARRDLHKLFAAFQNAPINPLVKTEPISYVSLRIRRMTKDRLAAVKKYADEYRLKIEDHPQGQRLLVTYSQHKTEL